MKDVLNGLFADVNAYNESDNDLNDFDFDGSKTKPFHVCFFMHNQEHKHKDYSNQYDESLDLFIPGGVDIE